MPAGTVSPVLDGAGVRLLPIKCLDSTIPRGMLASRCRHASHRGKLALANPRQLFAPSTSVNHSEFLPPREVDSTSTRLLARLGRDEPEAWRQLVRLYGPVVRYWVRRAGLNSADLADVFQEVFLAVSRNIAGFRRQDGQAKFRAWLKTVTQSKIQDHFRRKGRQPAAFGGSTALLRLGDVPAAGQDDESDNDDAALAHSEDAFLTHRTLHLVKQEFAENTWQAFYRTAVDGRTSQEAATELGMTALAVRKAKSRVLQRLREAMAEGDGSGDLPTGSRS